MLVTFVCSTVNGQSSQVSVEPGYNQFIDAIRDNQKTSIQFRCIRVRVVNHAGKARQFAVRMLHDSQTKLFFWGYFEMYQSYSSEWDAKQFTSVAIVYLSPDKLRIFTTNSSLALTILDTAEHQDSMDLGQGSVVHFFEKEPAPSSKWEFKSVNYLEEKPGDFLKQCITANAPAPRIENLQRQGQQWKVIVRAQNGNAAEISMDDSYNLISTKFIVNPAADSAGGCNCNR
jgi:hypothetical protein